MESMEWGVDCRNSRWIPWNGGWIPYFFQMDSTLFPDGFHTFSMEWGMDSIIYGDGFHGIGDGLHTFLRWMPWHGGWIPWNGIHGVGDFFISPDLNFYGIGSFKYW